VKTLALNVAGLHAGMSAEIGLAMLPAANSAALRSRMVSPGAPAPAGTARQISVTCATCMHRPACLTGGVPAQDLEKVAKVVTLRRRIRRREALFNAGDQFRGLYAICSGSFKSSVVDAEGHGRVTGFPGPGEVLGLDGMGGATYTSGIVAIEDSVVCTMPDARIREVAQEVPALEHRLGTLLAREITRSQGTMMLLGSMSGEARLATFLLQTSRGMARLGYSRSEFLLRMSRTELASYLGLRFETVSRYFSGFAQAGLIEVHSRELRILDFARLERVAAAGS